MYTQVVRLGGKKRAAGRNLQAARRFSDLLYNSGDGGDDIMGGNESRKEEQAQLSVACVFFTPRKYTRCKGNSCVLSYLIYTATFIVAFQTHP